MMKNIIAALALSVVASSAFAQSDSGVGAGAATGAVGGAIVGGPVGAVVGAVGGAVVGGLASSDERRFREYTVREKRPSYTYREEVRVGATLPESGVTYYDVPSEYKVQRYKYTVVNNRPVLVDPGSRRIIQVIE